MGRFFFFNWVIPLSILALLVAFSDYDIAASSFFFDGEAMYFPSNKFFDFVTFWGVIPAQISAVSAFAVLVLSYFFQQWKPFRKYALLLILPMALGAGLVVHPVLKDHWGRPRPRQVEKFGGSENFRPFYSPKFTWKSHHKSFPCGHCTMGFYFFSLMFLGMRIHNRFIFFIGLFISIALGGALSAARIAQGGHFFTDTVTTAILMWITVATCDRMIFGPLSCGSNLPCKG